MHATAESRQEAKVQTQFRNEREMNEGMMEDIKGDHESEEIVAQAFKGG